MKTKRIVITGGPGTGKSSVINALTERGFTCLEEISREVTLEAKKQGIDQLFLTEPLRFSEALLQGRLQQYHQAHNLSTDTVFFDRGIPDIVAYMDFAKLNYPEDFTKACHNHPYDAVFILKPWKAIYKTDNERYENFEDAMIIHKHLVNTYQSYNYQLIDVPFDTVEKRTDYILNIIHI
ncbi:ATP-binding protein [Gaetbulibacter sp. M240]|uniref:AAA family ATPase n=1 Tax=Gaetbulibacter sp. M240 TaxID=3126511 RepID=UPI00374F9840